MREGSKNRTLGHPSAGNQWRKEEPAEDREGREPEDCRMGWGTPGPGRMVGIGSPHVLVRGHLLLLLLCKPLSTCEAQNEWVWNRAL